MQEMIALILLMWGEVKIKELPVQYCTTSGVTGKYFPDSFSVEIKWQTFNQFDIWFCKVSKNREIPKRQIELNIAHELAHHFWYSKLSANERKQWTKLYNSCSKDSCFAKVYGKTNEREDFATVFEKMYDGLRAWKTQDKVLRAKIEFMEKLIKKYDWV